MIATFESRFRWPVKALALAVCPVLAAMFALAFAPKLGVLPIFAVGFLCGPLALLAYAAWQRPLIVFVATYAALAPIDFMLRVGGSGTAARFVALGAVAALCMSLVARGANRTVPRNVVAWLVLFAWMLATLVWSGDPAKSIERLNITGLSLIVFTLVSIVFADRWDLRAMMFAIVTSGVGVAVYALASQTHMRFNASRIELTGGGLTLNADALAFAFIPPLALAASGAVSSGSLLRRVPCGIAALVILTALVETQTRGGLLAVVAMTVWIGIRLRQPFTLAGLLALAVGFAATQPGFFARFSDTEGAGRATIWQIGLKAFQQHWMIGNGYGTFSDAYNQVYLLVPHHFYAGWSREAHNILISSFVELGVFGGGLLIYAWWCHFRQLKFVPRDDRDFWLRTAAEAGILATFVGALTAEVMDLKTMWILPMLIVLVSNVRGREAAMSADHEVRFRGARVRSIALSPKPVE